MKSDNQIYRRLQHHLNQQPVGFPRGRSGEDIQLLKRIFTPDEARLALYLTHKHATLSEIQNRAPSAGDRERMQALLDAMFQKGAIASKAHNGEQGWYLMPLVVGMFEGQVGKLTRRFAIDAARYMRSLSYGRSLIATNPSQMRTIPVNTSIPVERLVASYDDMRGLLDADDGPFVALPCICRKLKAMQQKTCKQTTRTESCLAVGETATMCLKRGVGRSVTREEALSMLTQGEKEGLVLQPSNTQRAEFVCSCCGCCCGMLGLQKALPRPVDFWTSNFYATVDDTCIRCGKCIARCQVDAVTLPEPDGLAQINRNRCIGCGLCVSTCPTQSIHLHQKPQPTTPPENEAVLYDEIKANKKSALGELAMLLKLILRIRQ